MLNFQEIIGHDQIKEHFQKAIEYNKVSHAYILTGEAGMGRKSLANAFALTLLCEKGKTETLYGMPRLQTGIKRQPSRPDLRVS